MRLTYFASSTVLLEAGNKKILMDPWLEDGEYYGSWAHVPPVDVDYGEFDDVDYIYISHIHPDHLSPLTLARLPKRIPVLIHSYDGKFLKRNVEAAGFEVRELPHNLRTDLGDGVTITILAADDCNPEICGAYFSCAPLYGRAGSTQIDSLCVVEHGGQVLVNTNDCPFGLARHLLPRLLEDFGHVDLLLTGYSGAGPYPQCFTNLSDQEKLTAASAKRIQFLDHGLSYINALRPRFVLPFAGQYTLSGRLSDLNALRGVAELSDAREYFHARLDGATKVILLARHGSLDLSDGRVIKPYEPMTAAEHENYVETVLSRRCFSFDGDEEPEVADLVALATAAAERAERKRQEMGISSDTRVYVRLAENLYANVSFRGEEVIFCQDAPGDDEPHIVFSVEPKLLKRILSGPRFAHWNNATIGSHVRFHRVPNRYEAPIYDVMNYFHA